MWSKFRFALVTIILLFSLDAMAANPKRLCRSVAGHGDADAPFCDLSFTTVGLFACGAGFPQTGVYTIRNNTPVTQPIRYIRLQNNGPATGAVTITGNTCGASLAPGASCTVTISLASSGPFNQILQVGVDSRQGELDSPVITPTVGCTTATTPSIHFTGAPLFCNLLSLANVGVMAGSSITNTGNTVVNGDLDLSPGTSVTGFTFSTPPGPGVVTGAVNIANATALTAQNDYITLNNCLAVPVCTQVITTADQAGATYNSAGVGAVNVVCSPSTILDNGVLTLNGDATSVFIIRAPSAATSLTMGPGSSIVLTGGLTAANVFWQIGGTASLNTTTAFQGTILASTSITLANGATILGRLLAQTAAVTFINNTETVP